jgi:hypothetical protein
VALVALVLVLVMPRLQPATGTLLVAVSSRTAGSLPQSALMVHGSGQWVPLGNVSGAVPAAPAERDLTVVSLSAGVYDGVRLGGDLQNVSFTITGGQVEPLLLGIDSGNLIPGAAYAGNDEVNLGLGELAGRFVAMPAYDLMDQQGHAFNPTTTSGKDLVIAAFHTTCHETCPLYTALFLQISKQLPAGVTLAEVTTDPATDTPERTGRLPPAARRRSRRSGSRSGSSSPPATATSQPWLWSTATDTSASCIAVFLRSAARCRPR